MTEASKGADLLFTQLADAVRYSQNWARSIKELEVARARAKSQLDDLDDLEMRIAQAFDHLSLDAEDSESLFRRVKEFVGLAAQQTKERVRAKLEVIAEEYGSDAKSEELKARRALEAYLASSPLPVLDEEVSLRLEDSSYSATVEYKCPGDIEYEFLLNSAGSPHFRGEFTFAGVRRGVKLPVRLGKNWLRKEPVPDFEKLDEYVLSEAKASRNHLEATFANEETGGEVSMVFSRSESDSFVTIEYSNDKEKVDVTGEAGLSKHLDLPMMKGAGGHLLDAILELRNDKRQLSRLESEGEDVLVTLDFMQFMQHIATVLVQDKELMLAVSMVDQKMAVERLKLLGPGGSKIIETLGLDSRRVR